MLAFTYPKPSQIRRHGPNGYAHHLSYRPWLRDEFAFRCAYCLMREQWGKVTGEFDIEHFYPQVNAPERAHEYDNLFNSCRVCNVLKGGREIPEPFLNMTCESIRVHPNGTIEGLTKDAQKIIRVIGLDSESYNRWRRIWIRNVELAVQHDPEQYLRLMGFPLDLPNLEKLKPPAGNSRPEGIIESYHYQCEHGKLPETY